MSDTAAAVVRAYYKTLRQGDPLPPYFLVDESTTKFGISEGAFGYDAVADALESQTETTTDWTVESHGLEVTEHGEYATFADEVTMAWTDLEAGTDRRFETRWSGTLVRRDAVESKTRSDGSGSETNDDSSADRTDGPAWLFRTMHVSTADKL
ncbi:nuclear transport factor 2 family protein [Natronococcus sp.]|uniref:nuclear transport factor 2 family protein n=1 Tax=Natronococcus sp. TaxID=35747 RepID=UPI0025EB4272|nr:nuclear transport factor 2 family protein [Natronococcus sp.]